MSETARQKAEAAGVDTSKMNVVLDASDENFAADLMAALGVEPGDAVNIITPQFDREDGRVVTYFPQAPSEYDALPLLLPVNLEKIGCQVWEEKNGMRHWLFPREWFSHIPKGREIVTINGQRRKFDPQEDSDDSRFGALAYGFLQPMKVDPPRLPPATTRCLTPTKGDPTP